MKSLFLLLTFAFIAPTAFAQGSWAKLHPFPGGPRYGATSLVVGDKLYVGLGAQFNGYATSFAYNDWWEYDVSNDTWRRNADFPDSIYYATAMVIDGHCYAGLGSDAKYNLSTQWYEFDADQNTWIKKADFPDAGRYGVGVFVIDSIGYLCCGNEGNAYGPYSNQLWSYNPAKDKWTLKSRMPAKSRYAVAGFSINGRGYIEGGAYLNPQYSVYKFPNDFYEYNPASDSWTQKSNFPTTGRSGTACFVLNNKAYIGLGQWGNDYRNNFYTYDPSTDSWGNNVAWFPAVGRIVPCSFSMRGSGYVMLGQVPYCYCSFEDVWKYTPSLSKTSPISEINEKPAIYYSVIGKELVPSFNPSESASTFIFKLYDLSGRLLQSQTISGNSVIYLDAALPKGIYLITTFDGKTSCLQKVLVE